MSSFYSYFLEECAKKKVSPSKAASEAGLSRAASSGWKKGALPSDINLQALANYFGISAAVFHECDDIKERDLELGIVRLTEELRGVKTSQKEKKTVTSGDGQQEERVDINKYIGNRAELKRLVDRLTDQEVDEYLAKIRATILGQ